MSHMIHFPGASWFESRLGQWISCLRFIRGLLSLSVRCLLKTLLGKNRHSSAIYSLMLYVRSYCQCRKVTRSRIRGRREDHVMRVK
jgi:hypothetical protein